MPSKRKFIITTTAMKNVIVVDIPDKRSTREFEFATSKAQTIKIP
jgi:hypothetical protein